VAASDAIYRVMRETSEDTYGRYAAWVRWKQRRYTAVLSMSVFAEIRQHGMPKAREARFEMSGRTTRQQRMVTACR
jgi:hypothetical protein